MIRIASLVVPFAIGIFIAGVILYEGFRRNNVIQKIGFYVAGFILLGEAYLIINGIIIEAKARGFVSIGQFLVFLLYG